MFPNSSHWSRVVIAATLCCLVGWQAPASAGFILDAKYTAVITDIQEYDGAFGPIAVGDTIGGILRYSYPAFPPDYNDGTFAEYNFTDLPGGSTLLTADFGSLHLEMKQNLTLDVYNDGADSFYGYDFQFYDPSTSIPTPGGYTISSLAADVGLYVTDPSLLDFPNPPSALPPFGAFDPYYSGGYFIAQVKDAGGDLVETALYQFQLTSLSAIPEPSSALLAVLAIPLIAAWTRRRAKLSSLVD